tara:strand:+ start:71 stop:316 length:246 start_codon:yes stop_codon:yes gene_type:complete
MSAVFTVGDVVLVENLPKDSDSILWPKRSDGPFLGTVIKIVESQHLFFKDYLSIKMDGGEVITLSSNMVKPIWEGDNSLER